MNTDSTMSERKDCMSDMPAALMAVSSELSPRFPYVMSEDSSMARGKACGTSIRLMYQKNCANISIERPLSYQFVYISPQKLHHQHKLADEECPTKTDRTVVK